MLNILNVVPDSSIRILFGKETDVKQHSSVRKRFISVLLLIICADRYMHRNITHLIEIKLNYDVIETRLYIVIKKSQQDSNKDSFYLIYIRYIIGLL